MHKGGTDEGGLECCSYITQAFDRWARLYDPFLSLFRLKGVRRETVKMSGARPGDRGLGEPTRTVLDVCTGTGDVALEFARRCDDVTGIDLSAGMLAIAQRKDRDGRVRFLRMDATRLAFADESFDVSVISFGLHDMPPDAREATLREIARVSNRIVIVDYKPPRSPILRAFYIAIVSLWESKDFLEFAKSDFRGLLARCGLRVEREKPTYFRLLRIYVCRPDQEAGDVQGRGRFLGLRGNQPRSTRFSCLTSYDIRVDPRSVLRDPRVVVESYPLVSIGLLQIIDQAFDINLNDFFSLFSQSPSRHNLLQFCIKALLCKIIGLSNVRIPRPDSMS